MPKPLIVQFTPIRSCLVNLPSKWVSALLDQNKLPQNVILEIQTNTKRHYFGWSGEASKALPPHAVFTAQNNKLDVLEMDPQVGLAIGLQDGQKVSVDFCKGVPDCLSVSVEPYTEDDWEILELHAQHVEENLLSQLRVVYTEQVICVWIHGKTLVRLVVAGELDPNVPFAKLSNLSQVVVAPKVRRQATVVKEEVKVQKAVALRTSPGDTMDDLQVLVHPESVGALKGVSHVRLKKLVPAFQRRSKVSTGNDTEHETEEETSAVFATLVVHESVPLGHVMVGAVLKMTLGLKDFDIVKLSTSAIKKSPVGSIILKRFINSTQTIKLGLESQQKLTFEADCTTAMRDWLDQHGKEDMVLSEGLLITLTVGEKKEEHFQLSLGAKKGLFSGGSSIKTETNNDGWTVLTRGEKPTIEFGEPVSTRSFPTPTPRIQPVTMGGVDTLLKKIQQYTLANLSQRELKGTLCVPRSGGILLTGAHGAGKTALIHNILSEMDKHAIYTIEIQCAEYADERVPVLKEMISQKLDEAAWHGPTVVFFNDLDRLMPAEVEHADSSKSRHVAELFVRMASLACQRHAILLVATAQQQQSIHPALITHHLFSDLHHLQPPNRDERKLIMEAVMSSGPDVLKKSLPLIDLVSVASETEGFLAADIKAFLERTVHEGAVRSIKCNTSQLLLKQEDFSMARQGFVPSSLRGIKLQSSGVHWSDIGGLNETRKALLETLEWPTKYAAVFAQCPLRLRSGLLLYGYPGCGKTLLASAVAKECGLNFISVKGPEILNKYIGASEKSVRDLFERAQAAKPCVLFFDEFDSIAPRRGHDSTGVTDRVVNQMLTQMDGAEGLDGVYVLAATSRPDLIDPALLRPGRLDKALLCGLPNVNERLEILQALGLKMKLASNVDLKDYAEKTEGFSGADLQGFLYNAHLSAIHGTIDMSSFKEKEQDGKTQQSTFVSNQVSSGVPLTSAEKSQIAQRLAMIKKKGQKKDENTTSLMDEHPQQQQEEAEITRAFLDKSLRSTRPSITAEESHRLGLIYNEFVTGRTGELPSGEGEKGVGKRSTLG
ncbi:P-loop containing nucleoside triphosphate hydrolase protein [Mucor mucedo]|uniref:P-loop containing nucleoside triphosphate hydrolase protein n=1 Tax=Mucor mucedo TaxID=29922 RepID=UPI00221EE1F9|nr:P-loop containing nucleoside triphosphate hydrolase protein [Mucor mucedo]KAI7894222.1 P-loop containing nucleoside triphosphate hydrolase protein [Mucor mucedo]